jgi:hypothetical protein
MYGKKWRMKLREKITLTKIWTVSFENIDLHCTIKDVLMINKRLKAEHYRTNAVHMLFITST